VFPKFLDQPAPDEVAAILLPSRDREGAQPPPDAAQNKKRIARSAADRQRQLRDSSEACIRRIVNELLNHHTRRPVVEFA
jgi:hypothetical protein